MSDDSQLFHNTNHSHSLEKHLPTLSITSFGHRRGPLLPAPDLSFDLRDLPNPPKNVRTGHTGLSKTLRDAFLSIEAVKSRFDSVCDLINVRLQEAQRTGEDHIAVGVFCELGKHRSVSMVEQLGRTRFSGWNVVVQHRDVHIKRTGQRNKHRLDRQVKDDQSE